MFYFLKRPKKKRLSSVCVCVGEMSTDQNRRGLCLHIREQTNEGGKIIYKL